MPCLEWLAAKVEWEQGSGPKGPMSCRTQVYFQTSSDGTFFAFGATFLVIQWEDWIFFHFIVNFPCYSIWILHLFQSFVNFSMLFNGCFKFFSFFYQFSMLFNGNFAFLQFSMLFNGNMRLRSFGEGGGRKDGRTDGSVSDSETMSQYWQREHSVAGK